MEREKPVKNLDERYQEFYDQMDSDPLHWIEHYYSQERLALDREDHQSDPASWTEKGLRERMRSFSSDLRQLTRWLKVCLREPVPIGWELRAAAWDALIKLETITDIAWETEPLETIEELAQVPDEYYPRRPAEETAQNGEIS
jgi:hypothetical protein